MRKIMMIAAALAAAPALAAPAGTAFDGQWDTQLVCQDYQDAAGYSVRFNVFIQNGHLHGDRLTHGDPGYLLFDGTLQDDGSVTITADGITGDPKYSVGHLPSGTELTWHADAKFDAAAGSGTGTRTEIRPCSLYFTKVN